MGTPIQPFDIFQDVDTSKGYTAILSVANEDKPAMPDFVRALHKNGFNHFRGSAGTMKLVDDTLRVVGLGDKIDGGEITIIAVGEVILDHLIATLYPRTHGGLLALPTQQEEMGQLGLDYFQLAFVSFYRLKEAIKKGGDWAAVVGDTDMGGPALARSAAKGQRVVIVDPADCEMVAAWLRQGRPDSFKFMEDLRAKAYHMVSIYNHFSAKFHGGDKYYARFGQKGSAMKYGENPQQKAVLYNDYTDNPFAIGVYKDLNGEALGAVTLTDISSLQRTMLRAGAMFVLHSEVPHIVLGVKHDNVCGAGVASTAERAIELMLAGDPISIFGGAVMTNFHLEASHAEMLRGWGMNGGKRPLDVICAPSFDDKCNELLRRADGRTRICPNPALKLPDLTAFEIFQEMPEEIHLPGGVIVQDPLPLHDLNVLEIEKIGPEPSERMLKDLLLGIAICATATSNTIVAVRNGQLIGAGVAQKDRVGAADLCAYLAKRAGHSLLKAGGKKPLPLTGAVIVSDSFFPFEDGPRKLINAGAKFIFATTGTEKRAKEIARLCERRGITLWRAQDKAARMFAKHC